MIYNKNVMKRIAIIIFIISVFSIGFLFPASDDLYALNGEKVKYSSVTSPPKTILMFWTSWCPYCYRQLQGICSLISKYKGINFVFINLTEGRDKIKSFINKNFKGCIKNVFIDKKGDLAKKFGVLGVPTFIFLKDSKEVHRGYEVNSKVIDKVYGSQ